MEACRGLRSSPQARPKAEDLPLSTISCRFSSALLPETLHNKNRPGCDHLLTGSMYALQLAPWLEHFQPEQLLVVQKGDLADRPRLLLENVSAFLGSPHKYSQDKGEVKGGATKKPKKRDFKGDAQLPEALHVALKVGHAGLRGHALLFQFA